MGDGELRWLSRFRRALGAEGDAESHRALITPCEGERGSSPRQAAAAFQELGALQAPYCEIGS